MDIQKLRLPLGIIIVGEVIFLVLFALYKSDLIELKTLNTLVVVEMVAGVLGYLLGKRNEAKQIKREEEMEARKIAREDEIRQKERKYQEEAKKQEKLEQEREKRREELKNQIYNHIKFLTLPVLKDWYGEQKPLGLKEQQKATDHLKGYPNLWTLFEECKNLRDQISKDEKSIKNYAKEKSYLELIDALEDDYLFQEEASDWGKVSLKKGIDLIDELLDKSDIGTSKDNYIVENSKRIIETFEKDDKLSAVFKMRKRNKNHLNEKVNEFNKGLEKIVYEFEKRNIMVEGRCDDCKDWHDELDKLKTLK